MSYVSYQCCNANHLVLASSPTHHRRVSDGFVSAARNMPRAGATRTRWHYWKPTLSWRANPRKVFHVPFYFAGCPQSSYDILYWCFLGSWLQVHTMVHVYLERLGVLPALNGFIRPVIDSTAIGNLEKAHESYIYKAEDLSSSRPRGVGGLKNRID